MSENNDVQLVEMIKTLRDQIHVLEKRLEAHDELHAGQRMDFNWHTRIIELDGRIKKLEEYRVHALDQVRLFNDTIHKLEQSCKAHSQSNTDLFERILALEASNANADDGLAENAQAIHECEADLFQAKTAWCLLEKRIQEVERLKSLTKYLNEHLSDVELKIYHCDHDERIKKLENMVDIEKLQACIFDGAQTHLSILKGETMHKDHYANHEQLKKEFQLIVQAQDSQCVQIEELEKELAHEIFMRQDLRDYCMERLMSSLSVEWNMNNDVFIPLHHIL